MSSLIFEKIEPTEVQIELTFNLLRQRTHKISHKEISFAEHKKFTRNFPYRSWFLIKKKEEYLGTFYIAKDNTIGINVTENHTILAVESILEYVGAHFEPLPAVPSVRSGRFAINVPPTNEALIGALEGVGARIAQVTYYLPTLSA